MFVEDDDDDDPLTISILVISLINCKLMRTGAVYVLGHLDNMKPCSSRQVGRVPLDSGNIFQAESITS